jgi:hypothetical protein
MIKKTYKIEIALNTAFNQLMSDEDTNPTENALGFIRWAQEMRLFYKWEEEENRAKGGGKLNKEQGKEVSQKIMENIFND